jgi:hypothetical protein
MERNSSQFFQIYKLQEKPLLTKVKVLKKLTFDLFHLRKVSISPSGFL